MEMHDLLTKALRSALTVPLAPAPGRLGEPSAVYRYRPGRSDGALQTAHLTVRVFHRTPSEAAAELAAVRKKLSADGDSGVVGEGGGALVICGTDEGGAAGRVRGMDLYYVQAGFEVLGRA